MARLWTKAKSANLVRESSSVDFEVLERFQVSLDLDWKVSASCFFQNVDLICYWDAGQFPLYGVFTPLTVCGVCMCMCVFTQDLLWVFFVLER